MVKVKSKKASKDPLYMARLAKLAQLSQKAQNQYLNTISNGRKKHSLEYYEKKGTELCFVTVDQKLYISFRGTELHHTDIIPHAMRWGIKTNVGHFHKGYWKKFNMVADKILTKARGKEITLVGHSLGGALAQIAFLWLKKQLPNATIKCMTFGSCKPLKEMPQHVSLENVHNYYLYQDYVGLFPFGYHVLTPPILIDSIAAYKANKPAKGFGKIVAASVGFVKTLCSIFVTKRHAINSYIETIKNL